MAGLMMCFHGWGIPNYRFRHVSGLEEMATGLGCKIVFPQSLGPGWGPLDPHMPPIREAERMDKLLATYGHSPSPLLLVGFSDGASFAATLGLRWREKTTAVVVHAGALQVIPTPGRTYPILYCRFDDDMTVKWEEDQKYVDAYTLAGFPVKLVSLGPGRHHWGAEQANGPIREFLAAAIAKGG